MRTRLIAPFDAVVVRGDLSQSLGSPVQRGDVLFEVAPLDGYRIILEIDERNISDTSIGQRGHLTLSALPRQPLPLIVERLTPVATAEESLTPWNFSSLRRSWRSCLALGSTVGALGTALDSWVNR